MEICFIPDNNYKRFIREYAKNDIENLDIKEGETLNEKGDKLGTNEGYINYTIGQRKGIGISNPNPLYVKNIDSKNNTAVIEHEASTSKINEDQLYYCRQRGLSHEEAVSLIVNGFCKQVLQELPMEFAVEAQKLVAISLEGSVG